MAATTMFRDQHDRLLSIAGRISDGLNPANVAANPAAIRADLSELIGTLKSHLAMEDKTLYPRMAQSDDPKVSSAVERFQNEMGSLAPQVVEFSTRWSAGAIGADATNFIKETTALFGVLKARIDRENTVLYPLADAQ